jgi:large-conductance mechanosensitive channel
MNLAVALIAIINEVFELGIWLLIQGEIINMTISFVLNAAYKSTIAKVTTEPIIQVLFNNFNVHNVGT